MPRLSLSLLGPFQVTLDGHPITAFESDKVRALLAYLAVESDRPHRRERLAGLLWPERSERSARQNLSQALFNLRHIIGDRDAEPPFLLITPQTIQFNRSSDHWLDVTAFEALLAACEAHPHRRLETCGLRAAWNWRWRAGRWRDSVVRLTGCAAFTPGARAIRRGKPRARW